MICILLLISQDQHHLKDLGNARIRLDRLARMARVSNGGDRATGDGIFAMMEGQWTEVYYPAGKSSRRFTVRFGGEGGGEPFRLQYQALSKVKVRVGFSLPLAKGKSTPLKGPIIRWLQNRNIVVKQPQRLSVSQRAILSNESPLAGYMELDPMTGSLLAGWIAKDGTVASSIVISNWAEDNRPIYLPITGAEAKFLKLGKHGWPTEGIPHRFEYESPN